MADLKSSATRNLAHYREIHRTDPRYGRSSQKLVGLIADAVRAGQATTPGWQPKTLLDFGCGKSQAAERVAKKLGLTHFLYDPAIPGLETLPVAQADLVMNTDVLEHLDETEVDLLISDVRGLTDHAYFNIATAPASKVLDSGENGAAAGVVAGPHCDAFSHRGTAAGGQEPGELCDLADLRKGDAPGGGRRHVAPQGPDQGRHVSARAGVSPLEIVPMGQ